MKIGEKIKSRREELGLRQVDLAVLSGITQATLSRIENGEIGCPRADNIAPLADALQVSIDYLLREQVDKPKGGSLNAAS